MKVSKAAKLTLLVEGEMEAKLLRALCCRGKVIKHNFWNNPIAPLLSRFNRDTLVIVFDTDVLDNVHRFCESLADLKKNRVPFYLLQQSPALEAELAKACGCDIRKVFGVRSMTEAKERFMRTSDVLQHLTSRGFVPMRLWCGDKIEDLSEWHDRYITYAELMKIVS